MTTEIIKLVIKAVKAWKEPYGFESVDLHDAMDELDELTKDGYCSEGDRCNCWGDTDRVRMSCCRWVK